MKATLKQLSGDIRHFDRIQPRRAGLAAIAAAFITSAAFLHAATVEPDGYSTAFDTQPVATDWGSASRPGASNDDYDMDADVNAMIFAGMATNRPISSSLNPPGSLAQAGWSSSGRYLQLRPTGGRYTALMGKFVNNTGTNATGIGISYLHRIAGNPALEEVDRGLRVYYSITGHSNTWVNLAAFNSTATNGTFNLSTNLALNWPYRSNLFLLWVDDNALPPTDVANQIDDFSLHVTAGAAPTVVGILDAPTNNAVFFSDATITPAVSVFNGTPPYLVQFYTNGGTANTVFQLAGSANASPFEITLGPLSAGTYNFYATVGDENGSGTVTNTATNTITVVNALVNITNPTNGQTSALGQPLLVSATATVGASVSIANIEFFFDGVSAGSDNTAPYSIVVPPPTETNHTVYVAVTDSLGRTTYSTTNTVTVAFDPLGNDNFADRYLLSTPASVTGANDGATTQQGERTFFFSGGQFAQWGATLWYRWVAPFSAGVTIDTFGSDFNTYLSVYTGNAVNALSLVAENDNAPGVSDVSRVTFNAQVGTEYQIQVGGLRAGFQGPPAVGALRLNLTMPPFAAITNPPSGTMFSAGTDFTVGATAASPSATITNVSLFRGSTLLGVDTEAPYSFTVSDAPAGTNLLYAVAFDAAGQFGTSAVVRVFVANAGITIASPIDGSLFAGGSAIPISVFAAPPSGTITNVVFFANGAEIGRDNTAPFNLAWTNADSGSHRLTAVASADDGATYESQIVFIGVGQTFIAANSVWKYRDDGSDQGTAWREIEFSDSTWAEGPAPLGYSDSNGRLPATTTSFGPDEGNKFITTYFRQSFTVMDVGSFGGIVMNIQRDDGAIVYLNGAELGRFNMPTGTVTYTTGAGGTAGDDGGTTFTMPVDASFLREGLNVVAVEIHQDSGSSSDTWFVMDLIGIPTIDRNLLPFVALTSPTNGASFVAPASIALSATASDADGSVVRVEYFSGDTKIGESTDAPFSATWLNPVVGPHAVFAIATDDHGAMQHSAMANISVFDAAGNPIVALTSPTNSTVVEGPTNMLITAIASALDSVASVEFYVDGASIGSDATSPYSVVWNAPFGIHDLYAVVIGADARRGTSAVINATITIPPTNTVAPTIARQIPAAASDVTNASFSSLTVIFSERVQNVDAADLLVNGVPATSVSGSGSNYVFEFTRPAYGAVVVSFAPGHGITDFGFPGVLPFDASADSATWTYNFADVVPPTITARSPAPGALVTNLAAVSVTFSEEVTGVDAEDLLVNGVPAFAFTGSGANYTFNVIQPASGQVNITWATGHGIADLGLTGPPIPFNGTGAGATWNFNLDSRTTFVQSNSTWRLMRGLAEASSPMDAWRQLAFDDSSWGSSPAPFVLNEPAVANASNPGTLLSDMAGNAYSSVYLRQPFVVTSLKAVTNIFLRHQSDDGFIAWINGVEILRYNMPAGTMAYNGHALGNAAETGGTNGAAYVTATLTSAVPALVIGTNILAVHAFNVSNSTADDFVFNAQLYAFVADDSFAPPRVLAVEPAAGDVFYLTNLTVTFSEPVTNVDAADLLVNGIPAQSVSSPSNTTYTFSFAQPAFGPVTVSWAPGHGIVDLDEPPKPFNGTVSSSIFNYALVNPLAPVITSQAPLPGTTITGLTSITITFNEPVTGVDASDLLVNGGAVSSVSGSGANYTFSFPQPVYGVVAVRWATNHGIQDLDVPANAFDGTRPAHQWSYALVDPVPRVTITSPTNGAYMLAPANVPLRATATDNDGTIVQVEYYDYFEGLDLGASTNAPYSITWSNVPIGTYTIRAFATDNTGIRATSAPVVIRVVTEIPALLVRGPYLQIGSPTGGVVRWRTDQIADSLVHYGTNPDALTNIAVGTPATREHVVSISGLQPDTKYYYSIGGSNQTLAGGQSGLNDALDYWFITSPLPGTPKPTRIWVLGDSGTAGNGSPDRQRSTRDAFYNYAAMTKPADIWLMLGDNAYNSGTDNEHQAAVFDMYPQTLRNLFLWPTLGNHETSQSTTATQFPYLDIFTLPTNGEAGGVPSGTEKYYSFDYGNIHFICLDSMTSGRTTNTAMANWLRNDLETSMQEWNIVFFHHPPYTKGSHDSDVETDLVQIRQNLVPILEAYGVDLVLGGHSHCYERSYLLDGQYGSSSTVSDVHKIDPGNGREDGTGAYVKNTENRGVVYTVAGSSGQATGGQLNHRAHFISLNQLGTMVIDVVSNRLDAVFITGNGQTNDHFTLLKRAIVPAPITIAVNGQGKVEGVTNGEVLNIGQSYTATATPAAGWVFVNWTGSITNDSATLDFVMESNLVLVANFAPDSTGDTTSPISLGVSGQGGVVGATNGQLLVVGHNYTVIAKPQPGWIFVGWSGTISSPLPTLNFVMETNLSLVANFIPDSGAPRPDQITLAIRGNGTVSGIVSGQILEIGQSYTILATPAAGWAFANWSGGVSGSSTSLTFVMESNLVIVANFVEQSTTGEPFAASQLTLAINGDGSVSGATNGQVLAIGSNYTLVATASPGWVFANWSGGVSGSSTTLSFVMESNLVVVANFVEAGSTNIPANQITVVVDGNGSVQGVTNAQTIPIGQVQTIVALPAEGWVFANWSGGVSGSSPVLTFAMQSNLVVVANFVPQGTNAPFVPIAGVFNGLFFEPNFEDVAHAGFFTLKLNSSGAYNATLRSQGKRYNARGRFADDGRATNRIVRARTDELTVIWEASLQDSDVLTGSVGDGQWLAPLLGDRAVFSANNPAPQAGRYTLSIPGEPGAVDSPAGDGYATVVVDAKGVVRMNGRLADKTLIRQNAPVSKNGDWPLYVPLQNGTGLLFGWMHFGDDGAADLSGRVRWIKPARSSSALYPGGFAVDSDAIGSAYQAPAGSDSVLQITDGLVILGGGNLPDSANPVTLGPRSKLVNNGTNTLKITFIPASGTFSGTFKESGGTKTFQIKGVVLQRQNVGTGYAPGTDQSGRVLLQPAPAAPE